MNIIFVVKNSFFRRMLSLLFFIIALPRVFPFRLLRKQAKKLLKKTERNLVKFYFSHVAFFVQEPMFVIIGAHDGLNDPYSNILLNNRCCKGLLIEPVPYNYNQLKANFSDSKRFILEQVAIDSTPGEATFYSVDPITNTIFPSRISFLEKIGSLNRKHIVKFVNGELEPYIVETKVKVCTLSCILKKNRIRDIHFLQIDTEGYDFEVLKTLDFANYSPVMIIIEHVHLSNTHKTEMVNLLKKYNYSIQYHGINLLALNKEAFKKLKNF